MRLLVRAEFRKLTAGVLLSVVLLLSTVSVVLATVQQDWAALELDYAARLPSSLEEIPCLDVPEESVECQNLRQLQYDNDREFIREMEHAATLAGAQQTFPGAVSFVAGMVITTPGLAIGFLLAAALVAGEWQRGTATSLFLAEQRLWRVLVAKTVVLATVIWGVLFSSAGVLYLSAIIWGRAAHPLADRASEELTSPLAVGRRLGITAVVLILFCGISVLIGAVMRQRLGTLLAGVLVIGLLNLAPATDILTEISPLGIISEIAALSDHEVIRDHLMAVPPPGLEHPGLESSGAVVQARPLLPRLAGCLAWVTGLALLLVLRLRARDLVEE